MKRFFAAVLLALLSTASLCAIPHPPPLIELPASPLPQTALLTVGVFKGDPSGDHKFPGQLVSMATAANPTGPTQLTDGAGNAWFLLGPGDYDVWVEPEGWTKAEQHVTMTEAPSGQTVRLSVTPIVPPTPPAPLLHPRRGLVRLEGRALRDDDGFFLGHGATLFWAVWGYQHDRARLEQNLQWLADTRAIDYIRALGTVGGRYWEDRTIDPRVPGYDAALAGLTDLAYDTYGLRTEWTIFGGTSCTPSEADRQGLVDRMLAMSQGRGHKILMFEGANEGYQTGFGGADGIAELRSLTRRLRDRSPILVAASSYHENAEEFREVYRDNVADLATIHLDRDSGEEGWRRVRQPWNYPGEFPGGDGMPPASDNEPVGPQNYPPGAGPDERDPTKLIAHVVVAHIAGFPLSVIHPGPGVFGGGGSEKGRGIPANLWETDRLTDTLRGLKATTARLPPDLPAWSRQNSGWPGTPFTVDELWPGTTADHGAVRVYSAVRGRAVVTLAFGVKRFVTLTAQWPMTVDVIRLTTGETAQTVTLAAGQTIRLEQGDGAWLLVSR